MVRISARLQKMKTENILIIVIVVLIALIVLYWLFTTMRYNFYESFRSNKNKATTPNNIRPPLIPINGNCTEVPKGTNCSLYKNNNNDPCFTVAETNLCVSKGNKDFGSKKIIPDRTPLYADLDGIHSFCYLRKIDGDNQFNDQDCKFINKNCGEGYTHISKFNDKDPYIYKCTNKYGLHTTLDDGVTETSLSKCPFGYELISIYNKNDACILKARKKF
jgi:hypothetical protein